MNERTLKYLYEYLEEHMIQSNWLAEHVPEQARALFITICFIGYVDADTKNCDDMLNRLYNRAALEAVGISYEDFSLFMCEFIV